MNGRTVRALLVAVVAALGSGCGGVIEMPYHVGVIEGRNTQVWPGQGFHANDPEDRGTLHGAVWEELLLRPELPFAYSGRHPEDEPLVRRWAREVTPHLNRSLSEHGTVMLIAGSQVLTIEVSRLAQVVVVSWQGLYKGQNGIFVYDLRKVVGAFDPGASLEGATVRQQARFKTAEGGG